MPTQQTSIAAWSFICQTTDINGKPLVAKLRMKAYEWLCHNWWNYEIGPTRQDIKAAFKGDPRDSIVNRFAELETIGLVYKAGRRDGGVGHANNCWRPYGVDELVTVAQLRKNKLTLAWKPAKRRLERLMDELELWTIPDLENPETLDPAATLKRLKLLVKMAREMQPDTQKIIDARKRRRKERGL